MPGMNYVFPALRYVIFILTAALGALYGRQEFWLNYDVDLQLTWP